MRHELANPCRIAVLLFWIAWAGCAPAPDEELRGRWVITAESRQRAQFGTARAELIVNVDGTFNAVEVPADMLYLQQSAPLRAISGSGRWTLTAESGREMLKLQFFEIDDVRRPSNPYGVTLHLTRRDGRLDLYYFSGDPDEGEVIAFAKI